MQLIIGSVGSGKSLFCRRYQGFLQPSDISKSTYWTFVDFNKAPENLDGLEGWLCAEFLSSFEVQNPRLDLTELSTLQKIFAPDINKIRRIYSKVATSDQDLVELKVADELTAYCKDPIKFAGELCRFLNGDMRKVVVVVFDNVDKLERGDQIRVFQAAQWFRGMTRSFCLLPLRDETYEQYKNRPPLDAFINAIHFTIISPRFIDVIRKRLELCLEFLAKSAPRTLSYSLPDGKKITYPATKLGEFLKTLYGDIFASGRRVGWLLEAIAGRNVRQALEMFTKILMSGHLDERQITGTLLGTEAFHIKNSTIVNVLMKTNYVYFDNDHGFLSNILYADPDWERHSNFLVFELLDFLVTRRKAVSVIGSQGYFPVREIIDHVNRMGFVPNDAYSALEYLLMRGLITADHFGKTHLDRDDFIRAHASGFVHARLLLENIHYVSGIATSLYVNDRDVAQRIGRLSIVNAGFTDIQFRRKKEIAFILLQYLKTEYDRHCSKSPLFSNLANSSRFALRMIETSLEGRSVGVGSGIQGGLL